jgi:hypothetical protein
MRLINVKTLRVEEFTSQNIPKYSILSHTWGDEEISLEDINNDRSTLPRLKRLKGWKKIEYCCEQSLKEDILYSWVDTCCIDKSSSAELSEAINSMYKWYSKSEICYAYLTDVDTHGAGVKDVDFRGKLQKSRWFTRGWTLQELIAPSELIFYDIKWTKLGTKLALNVPITYLTGIDYATLAGELLLSSTSIARRMSWASNRKTTRVEDIAYSLLGIV